MLSRVAERIYWTARYLERVENTARLLSVFNSLLLDLPQGVNLSWYTLIIINGAEVDFNDRYQVKSERNVVKFVLSDDNNPCSLINSIRSMKENIRTSRDVVPVETWELVNELNIFIKANLHAGINKGSRHDFLDYVVASCQQIIGLLEGAMSREASWYFFKLGVHLERADMVTRFLDVGAAVIMTGEDSPNREQIIWGNVLSSASAEMTYLKMTGSMVNGPEVAEFLIENEAFPRSIRFCLDRIDACIAHLPRGEPAATVAKGIVKYCFDASDYRKLGQVLRDHLNEVQLRLGALHNEISKIWFSINTMEQV